MSQTCFKGMPTHGRLFSNSPETLVTIIIWLVAGALLGEVATRVLRIRSRRNQLLNALLGMGGAALSGWLLSPVFGTSTGAAIAGVLVSMLGAGVLLATVNLFRNIEPRTRENESGS